jgi:amidase
VPYSDQKAWVGVATLSGLPATIAPIGHSESGLPIGAQIVGGYLEDRTTVAFARMLTGITLEALNEIAPPTVVRHS